MPRIGAYEAKTSLSRLLRRVEAGERFVITKHGRPVAELISFRPDDSEKVQVAIDDLREFRKTHRLDGLSVQEMIEEGRRL
ncbi:MAG: type II toxin-antitoxin system prevent-host-death family antitoxin [Gammaproteobacteria bacterium]|nr:type II toxin-antitoxin system prevent-host-death family antitoxin [Gammaproteobacteria bacterium]MDE0247797.1 type II toxin-antitoxin system prevent-host-death family antitoxin [Gammaproteobacteria bacterium]